MIAIGNDYLAIRRISYEQNRGQFFTFERGPAVIQVHGARVPFTLRKRANVSFQGLPGLSVRAEIH